MATYFVDTSALAKRYVNEVGTRWVRSWSRQAAGNSIIIAELAMVELFSVLARREQAKEITPRLAVICRQAFLYHVSNDYEVIQVNSRILVQSRDLVTKHVTLLLRTLDAIQLGCAMTARTVLGQPLTFVSADDRLLDAAKAEGFTTDDPRLYP